jgi:uncharacterized cupin superfamily protein
MKKFVQVALSEAEFRRIVSGQVVLFRDGEQVVEIALKDIGFEAMVVAVRDAFMNAGMKPKKI